MSEKILGLFDSYELKARVFPALVTISPVFFALSPWVLRFDDEALAGVLIGGLLLLVVILSAVGNNHLSEIGKELEKRLEKKWKGKATSRMLTGDSWLSVADVKKKRERLLTLRPNWGPSDPTCDSSWSDVDWATEQRNLSRKNEAVQDANRQYGMMRNLLGVRRYGLGLSVIGIASAGCYIYLAYSEKLVSQRISVGVIAMMCSALIGGYFWFYVTENAMKKRAEWYAVRLFDSIEPGVTSS